MPQRWWRFKLSADPAFVDKLRDVVGLYVEPPARAAVPSIDEKSQIQALDHTQPGRPLKKGRSAATMTHDYKRHDRRRLLAALEMLKGLPRSGGTAISQHSTRYGHEKFARLLDRIDHTIDAGTPFHAIHDNFAAHEQKAVRTRLEKHPRWTFHFTPTLCPWLNAIDSVFAELMRLPLKHGVSRSVGELRHAIQRFTDEQNRTEATPFVRIADPDHIIATRNRRFHT